MSNILMKETFKNKIEYLTKNYPKEVGGYIIGKWESGRVILEDLFIPEQEVTSSTIDMNENAILRLFKEDKDKFSRIIGEYHSHNTMSAFYSSTDVEDLIKPFMCGREKGVFVVSSFKENKFTHNVRIDINSIIPFSQDDLEYDFEYTENPQIQEVEDLLKKKLEEVKDMRDNLEKVKEKSYSSIISELQEEIKKKVKEKTYNYSYSSNYVKEDSVKNQVRDYFDENFDIELFLYEDKEHKEIDLYNLDEKESNYIRGKYRKFLIQEQEVDKGNSNFTLGNFKSEKHFNSVVEEISLKIEKEEFKKFFNEDKFEEDLIKQETDRVNAGTTYLNYNADDEEDIEEWEREVRDYKGYTRGDRY